MMLKILTVVGARPQFIKAATISREFKKYTEIDEIIVHTGQHYDPAMSDVFFDELKLPTPKYHFTLSGISSIQQISIIITELEKVVVTEKPDAILVYGDTNSTFAAAIVASKLYVKLIHIEAGLRSKKKAMQEELNRIFCDHASTLLFCPTKSGINNLIMEGFLEVTMPPYSIDNPKIYHCGDIMYDSSQYFKNKSSQQSSIIQSLNLIDNKFVLATVHRDFNTDNLERLTSIVEAFIKISEIIKVVWPIHPRTSKQIQNSFPEILKNETSKNLIIIDPISYIDMIALESQSKLIITDSGGVQKEAYFFEKPCVILRNETEWIEIMDTNTALLADTDCDKICRSVKQLLNEHSFIFPSIFGNGNAAEFIVKSIIQDL